MSAFENRCSRCLRRSPPAPVDLYLSKSQLSIFACPHSASLLWGVIENLFVSSVLLLVNYPPRKKCAILLIVLVILIKFV